jgi:hypothetical protein
MNKFINELRANAPYVWIALAFSVFMLSGIGK